ncbi:MAG TPA: glycosyltransferase [Candidatus Limnocylindrales bacterium]|nr:glycosyltransferase [Candidatus Limnocylindrales bacterium]
MATKIIEWDISQPIVQEVSTASHTSASQIGGLEGYQNLQVLVRMGRIPLGLVNLKVDSPFIEVSMLLREIYRQLGQKISLELARRPSFPGKGEAKEREGTKGDEKRDGLSSFSPLVSVCVCTRNRPDDLRRCLNSLILQDYPRYEILVIDNDPPTSVTKELVMEMKGRLEVTAIRYVVEPRRGLDFARNRAIQEARGEILSYLDDDTVADPGWITSIVENFQSDPHIMGCTGPNLALEMETEAQELMELRGGYGHWFEKRIYELSSPIGSCYPCKPIFGAGCNMSFRRKIFDFVGLFDEALDTGVPLPGGGDADMFYRIIRAGYKIAQDPRVLVWHRHRRHYKELRSQLYHSWGRGFMAYLVKSYLTDKPYRKTILSAIVVWYGYQLITRVFGRLRGKYDFPMDLILAEFLGGIVGLGSYFTSWRRIAKIKAITDSCKT